VFLSIYNRKKKYTEVVELDTKFIYIVVKKNSNNW